MTVREGRDGFRAEAGATCDRTGCSRRVSGGSWRNLFPNGEDVMDFGQKLEQLVTVREGRDGFRAEAGATCDRTGCSRRVSVRSWSKLYPNEELEKDFGQKLAQVVPEQAGRSRGKEDIAKNEQM
ncbi:hypothetical protein [Evansella tamaricis]|uniref:Uncharacterized protein n=1 Tax=Evansella tamaricis TaxID=2069301 RepID=A0ABS6JA86_9BACI|nr:hypothetical protein [Evansella tamaricis]MBU9710592.1 hypothetical protein [Evansella tamaricis]